MLSLVPLGGSRTLCPLNVPKTSPEETGPWRSGHMRSHSKEARSMIKVFGDEMYFTCYIALSTQSFQCRDPFWNSSASHLPSLSLSHPNYGFPILNCLNLSEEVSEHKSQIDLFVVGQNYCVFFFSFKFSSKYL